MKSRMPEIVEPKQLIQSRVLVKRARLTVKRGAARQRYICQPLWAGWRQWWNMQSSATRFWHLMHPVQDCPDNCARKEQFDTNLLHQMASLIIMLSRRSSNLLQRYTLATIQLACLNCKAIVTGARSWALHLGKLPCGLLLPYQWLV